MTRRSGRSAANDPGLAAVLGAHTPATCLVGKSWDFHVDLGAGHFARRKSGDDRRIDRARRPSKARPCSTPSISSTATRPIPAYALDCLKAALEAGARWIVLCDTNGGTLPHEVERIVAEIAKHVPGDRLGIHCHNDTENAVANSLAAVRAGARQIQGTLNGLGERCGNANLVSLIPTLMLKVDYATRFETGIAPDGLHQLTHVSRLLDERLNRAPNRHARLCRRRRLRP